jgi:hypothetical protein
MVKQHLGCEEGATRGCDSVMSHVHGVYGASMLLSMAPPGGAVGAQRLGDKQRQRQQRLENPEKRRVLQQLTQMGGVQRYQDALRQALAVACCLGSLTLGGLQGLHGSVGATFK